MPTTVMNVYAADNMDYDVPGVIVFLCHVIEKSHIGRYV